jgi:hypothetical protein
LAGVLFGLQLEAPNRTLNARTWEVFNNPDDPVGLVATAMDSSASGDTILIHPGVYYEHISLPGKNLVIRGVEGANVTTLSGLINIPETQGAILFSSGSPPGDITLEGLRLADGRGATGPSGSIVGGAVAFWGPDWDHRLVLRECVIEDNGTGYASDGSGGGLYIAQARSALIEGCVFRTNSALWTGGSVAVEATTEEVTFDGCHFDLIPTAGSGGAGVSFTGPQPVIVRHCAFEADAGQDGYTCLAICSWDISIEENSFIDRGMPLATRLNLGYGGCVGENTSVRFLRNKLWRSSAQQPGSSEDGVSISAETVEIESNSLLGSGVQVVVNAGSPIGFSHNIIYEAGTSLHSIPGAVVMCNDFFPEEPVTAWGDFILEDNLFSDPLFCEEGTADWEISFDSPCTDEYSPPGCGLIGAGEIGCDVVGIEVISWGKMKLGFR